MKNLIKQARSMLGVTPERWQDLAQALPADLLRRRPAPNEWSVVECLEMLETIGEAVLDRRVRHEELGPVSLGEMLSEWAAHDLNHTIQAERALMPPYLAECGPWIVYFKEHFLSET